MSNWEQKLRAGLDCDIARIREVANTSLKIRVLNAPEEYIYQVFGVCNNDASDMLYLLDILGSQDRILKHGRILTEYTPLEAYLTDADINDLLDAAGDPDEHTKVVERLSCE